MFRLKLAYLNLLRNRRRSALSVMIISIAVFALMNSGGFGLFTYKSLQEAAARDTGHIIYSQPGFFEKEEDYPLQNGLDDVEGISKQFIADQRVKAVQPRIEFNGLVSNGEKSSIFIGLGVNANEFTLKGPFLMMTAGKTLSLKAPDDDPQIMLGKDLARNLKLNVGDYATLLTTTATGALNAVDFKVIGIFSSGVPDLDKRQIYISIPSAQFLLDSSKVSYLSIFAYQTDNTEGLIETFNQTFTELEDTPWWQRAFFYEKVKNLYDRIFGVMGVIMALVVFVSLFNTLAMSVTERTREIGTLSALGATPWELTVNFILESLLLAITGILIGLVLAGLTTVSLLFLDIQMPPPPGRSVGYPLNIYFSFQLAWIISISITCICVVASWLAASKGVRRPITEALVYV